MEKIKVFIADDHQLFRDGIKYILSESEKFTTIGEASNGKELLEKLERTEVDIILLDINMPVMNGWEFLDAVQEKHFRDKIFVAMVTSSINSQDANTAQKYPQVIDYIEKPLRKEAFAHLWEKICRLKRCSK